MAAAEICFFGTAAWQEKREHTAAVRSCRLVLEAEDRKLLREESRFQANFADRQTHS